MDVNIFTGLKLDEPGEPYVVRVIPSSYDGKYHVLEEFVNFSMHRLLTRDQIDFHYGSILNNKIDLLNHKQ